MKLSVKVLIEKMRKRLKPVPETVSTRADRLKAYEERIDRPLKRRV